jgi:catechol 2,3-dioxygenase-like lactoylglutathione lyase family enzyme
MHFARVVLQARNGKLAELVGFYLAHLATQACGEHDHLRVGSTDLVFEAAAGSPFYHFAFLVPGDRFDEALQWARRHVELLPDRETGGVVFDFDNWEARAFYFHDPAGNIVELIAHRGFGEHGRSGGFDPSELLGLSEIGLIGDGEEIANGLREIGLRLWDGVLSPSRLAFFGERATTLIVGDPERGWLPTGRPAEAHPVDVLISGMPAGEVTVGAHRIRCRSD